MNFMRKYSKFTKIVYITTVSGSIGWIGYQVKNTHDIFSSSLDVSVLNTLDSPNNLLKNDENFVTLKASSDLDNEAWSLDNFWHDLKFSFAKRLLILANNDNKFIRKKAVRQLARFKNLDAWQCEVISKMMDARTAVGLARTKYVDHRLFTDSETPIWYRDHTDQMIVLLMKELLVQLHTRSQHPCMGYFISKAFVDLHDVGRFADHDAPLELKKFMQQSHEIIPMCLESLLHHASLGDYCGDIVDLNGLMLLMDIYHRFKHNPDVVATICRIISYLTVKPDLLQDIYKCGWIGILAECVNHQDVRISIPATKALANLDPDEDPLYLRRLYLLHPRNRSHKDPEVDVVFIHGLLGGVFFTWRQRVRNQAPLGFIGKTKRGRLVESIFPHNKPAMPPSNKEKKEPHSSDPHVQEFLIDLQKAHEEEICKDFEMVWEDIPTNTNLEKDFHYSRSYYEDEQMFEEDESFSNCWPRDWLSADCNSLRIIGVNYESNLSMWAPICQIEQIKTLEERSDELLAQLQSVGIGKRPVVWVTHSMGGLMVKTILCKAFVSSKKEVNQICSNTKGVVFFSTPHLGSSLANFSQASALVLWPTTTVQELQLNSPKLLEIHQKFLNVVRHVPMQVVTFTETKPTVVTAMKFQFQIVEPLSGNPGVGEYYEIPLDHLGICKPASRNSFLYQRILKLIQDVVLANRLSISETGL